MYGQATRGQQAHVHRCLDRNASLRTHGLVQAKHGLEAVCQLCCNVLLQVLQRA